MALGSAQTTADSYFSSLWNRAIIIGCARPGNPAWGDTPKLASAADLTAESGKLYFLRLVWTKDRSTSQPVKMEHIDPAEAQILIANSSLSTLTPRVAGSTPEACRSDPLLLSLSSPRA